MVNHLIVQLWNVFNSAQGCSGVSLTHFNSLGKELNRRGRTPRNDKKRVKRWPRGVSSETWMSYSTKSDLSSPWECMHTFRSQYWPNPSESHLPRNILAGNDLLVTVFLCGRAEHQATSHDGAVLRRCWQRRWFHGFWRQLHPAACFKKFCLIYV